MSEAERKLIEKSERALVIPVARALVKELSEDWSRPLQVKLADGEEGAELVFRLMEGPLKGVVRGGVYDLYEIPGQEHRDRRIETPEILEG